MADFYFPWKSSNHWIAVLLFAVVVTAKHPFWNIGHMVNSVKQIEEFLNDGSNAIEADVSFSEKGQAKETYHGPPCDLLRYCSRRENFEYYLSYVKSLTTPSSKRFRPDFTLLILDLKLSKVKSQYKYKAGEDVASKLIKHLWTGPGELSKVYIILSLPHTKHSNFILGFQDEIKKQKKESLSTKYGWDVSPVDNLNTDFNVIKDMFKRVNITKNVWLTDGSTNALRRGLKRTREAVRLRDLCRQPEWQFARKVYGWTYDDPKSMADAVRARVDGLIVNYPKRLRKVLNSKMFSDTHRLATLRDCPWYNERCRSWVPYDC